MSGIFIPWEEPGSGDSQWDYLYLDGVVVPGVWDVVPSWSKNIDVKKKKGSDLARTTDEGLNPMNVVMTGYLLSEHWTEFGDVMRTIKPEPGEARGAVQIAHPATGGYGITAIEIQDITGPEVRDNGVGEFRIYAIEWAREPKKKKAIKKPQEELFLPHPLNNGGTFPNWQRANSPYLGRQPPSFEVDLNLLVADIPTAGP